MGIRTTFSIFKYILIVILAIGLYWTWIEKERIAQNTHELKIQLLNLKHSVQSDLEKTKEKYKELEKQNEQLEKQIQHQEIKIVFPRSKDDFTKIIKKENDIIKDINLSQEIKESNDDQIKIRPEVFIDKEEKTLEGVKINIETKF